MLNILNVIDSIITDKKTKDRKKLRNEVIYCILSSIFTEGKIQKKDFDFAPKHHGGNELVELVRLIKEEAEIFHPYIADLKQSDFKSFKRKSFVLEQPKHGEHYTIKIIGDSDQGYGLALVLNDNSKNFAHVLTKSLKLLFGKKFDGWNIKIT